MEDHVTTQINKIVDNIKTSRKEKGYSLEYMAIQLGLSTSAYEKLEKQKTKLHVDKLLSIQIVLEIPLQDLLGLTIEHAFHQINQNHSSGFLINEQHVQNLYQDNQKTKDKLIITLEREVEQLQNLLDKKI